MSIRYLIFHGRFQPYHNGHQAVLDYLIRNTDDIILVGVVNPDPWEIWPGDKADELRFSPDKNPLTYWERYVLISEAIIHRKLTSRVRGIVPMPRPSINIDQAKRFAPVDNCRFVFTSRFGDELEEAKLELTKSSGGVPFIVEECELSEEVRPISSTLIRDLMATGDDEWKKLVPKETEPLYSQMNLIQKFTSGVSHNDAKNRIIRWVKNSPYEGWKKIHLRRYCLMDNKTKKGGDNGHDIFGAIATSVFGAFPIFNGLLRMRDEERQRKIENRILDEIKISNSSAIEEITKVVQKYSGKIDALMDPAFERLYSTAILEYQNTGKIDIDILMSYESMQGNKFAHTVKTYTETHYFDALVDLYDINEGDLWILLKDYGFNASYLKGNTSRARIRSFLQSLRKMRAIDILNILKAIHKEHPEIVIFDETFKLVKLFLPPDIANG